MTGLVRKALIFAAGLAVVASVASAGVPDPLSSSVESAIVGNATGNAIGLGGNGFDVVVKDINGVALVGVNVVIDFSATVCKLQSVQNGLTTVNCTNKTLAKASVAGGIANFAGRFGNFSNSNNVAVSGDGVALANVKARSTDFDNAGGTALADLSAFRVRFFDPAYNPEADYNVDGADGLSDLSIFRVEFFSGVIGSYCL